MLVLTRHIGEKIVIGDNIWVTVLAVNRHRIRLGIEAARSVQVDRGEVHAHRQEEIAPVAILAPCQEAVPDGRSPGRMEK